MKKHYSWLVSVAIFVSSLLVLGAYAYADQNSQFDYQMRAYHAQRAYMESKLGLDPNADHYPWPTSYYDDLVAHYEQVLIRSDEIDKGIR